MAKGETADLDRWLELDAERRAAQADWEECRADLNQGGAAIGAVKFDEVGLNQAGGGLLGRHRSIRYALPVDPDEDSRA